MIFFGAGDLVYKRAAMAGIGARHFIMLQAWFFCPLVTLYALARHQLVLNQAAWSGALAGLIMFFAFYNFSRSLRTGSISTNAPIFRLSFTLTAVLAVWLLHEPLTPIKLAGLSLALLAVLALAGDAEAAPRGEVKYGPLMQVLLATVAAGIGNLTYKVGLLQGSNPETLLSAQAWVFSTLATAFVWLGERRINPPAAGYRYGAMAAATLLTAFILLLNGLSVGPASVLIPVAQLGFVFTAVLGRVLFRETLSWRKRCGLVIAATAMLTLAFA